MRLARKRESHPNYCWPGQVTEKPVGPDRASLIERGRQQYLIGMASWRHRGTRPLWADGIERAADPIRILRGGSLEMQAP
jgi:hypothetical protein